MHETDLFAEAQKVYEQSTLEEKENERFFEEPSLDR